jgi:hypothetical protein
MRQLLVILFLSVIAYGLQAQVTYSGTEPAGFPNMEFSLKPTAGKKRIAEAAAQGKYTPEDLEIDSGYYQGAVITLKNDTVWGSIVVYGRNAITYLQLSVTFISKLGNKYLYKPADLNGFIIYKDSVALAFESLENELAMEVVPRNAGLDMEAIAIKSNRYFVQRLVSGPCTLYYVRRAREQGTQKIYSNSGYGNIAGIPGTNTVQYVNSEGEQKEDPASVGFHLKYFYCIKKNGGRLIYIRQKKAPTCFSDNRDIMVKISEGVYEYADMEKIVTEYNAWKERYHNATEQRY